MPCDHEVRERERETVMKKIMNAAGVVAASLPAGCSALAQDPDLVVFDWPGYEDSSSSVPTPRSTAPSQPLLSSVKKKKPSRSCVPASRLTLFAPVPLRSQSGLSRHHQPLDTFRIDRWDDINPNMRDVAAFQKDGEYYFLPADYGNTGMTYNTELLSEADVRPQGLLIEARWPYFHR